MYIQVNNIEFKNKKNVKFLVENDNGKHKRKMYTKKFIDAY